MGENVSVITSIIDYFKTRRWLLIWIGIFAAILIILGIAGQFRIYGPPTLYEWSIIGQVSLIWIIAKFVFKKDLTEEYLLGLIFGIQWEFLTEPYWTYLPDKFAIQVWKDFPVIGVVGWSTNFTIALLFSDWLGKKLFNLNPKELRFNWKVLLCDAISIQIIGSLAEWIYGIVLGGWKYSMPFGIGKSPLGLGWEVHIGYMIVFFWYGTTFRVWKYKLEGDL